MAFDAAWFDELRRMTDSVVARARLAANPGMPFPLPRLAEMRAQGLVSNTLLAPTMALTKAVQSQRTDIALEPHFIADKGGQHAYTRFGGYNDRQFNVAFTAGVRDTMRIGLGFPLLSPTAPAVMKYVTFRSAVTAQAAAFDAAYAYAEFDEQPVRTPPPISQAIIADTGGDWRFFGVALDRAVPADSVALNSIPLLAQRVISVYDHIFAAGF